jgi:hypothetical protein
VLREACSRLREWNENRSGDGQLTVSVNISKRQLVEPEFLEGLRSLFRQIGCPTRLLLLEITESICTGTTGSIDDTLRQLREMGIALHMDLTPAYLRAGPGVELAPLSAWRIRVTWTPMLSFGTFNSLMRFDAPDADIGERAIAVRGRAGRHHGPALSQRLLADNLLQIKLRWLVLADLTTVDLWSLRRDGYYYLGEHDLLMDGRGDVAVKNIAIAAASILNRPGAPELAAGVFHAIAHVVRSGGQNQQAGLALLHVPRDRAWLPPSRLGLVALLGLHLQDRSKALMPYGAVLIAWGL